MKPNDVIKKMKELGSNSDVEIKKIEQIDGAMEVTFMEDCKTENQNRPKSWEEFCALYPMKTPYNFTVRKSDLDPHRDYLQPYHERLVEDMEKFTGNIATAEAMIALIQLILLRNCYNTGHVFDYLDDDELKYIITFHKGVVVPDYTYDNRHLLTFWNENIRDEFLYYFKPLIEKLCPLYGVMEGGKE